MLFVQCCFILTLIKREKKGSLQGPLSVESACSPRSVGVVCGRSSFLPRSVGVCG